MSRTIRNFAGLLGVLLLAGCAGPLTIGGECTSMGIPKGSADRERCIHDRRQASIAAGVEAERRVWATSAVVAAAAIEGAADAYANRPSPIIVQAPLALQAPSNHQPIQISPIPMQRQISLCPDGSYVRGTCHLMPNGSYVGD